MPKLSDCWNVFPSIDLFSVAIYGNSNFDNIFPIKKFAINAILSCRNTFLQILPISLVGNSTAVVLSLCQNCYAVCHFVTFLAVNIQYKHDTICNFASHSLNFISAFDAVFINLAKMPIYRA